MYTDPISDYLTRVRNAQAAGHRIVEIPASNLKKKITEILHDHGFIAKYKFENEAFGGQGVIKIALKYDPVTRQPVIRTIKRLSRPGLRAYASCNEIPRTMSGLGVTILSTPKGVITDKEARKLNVGGELICSVS
ncbi:MAG: 30S ribosomal protein S8 [Chitinophagales bacterium]|nr:30S ribosomal protein S8 [Chitinophagales bacterium]